MCADIKSATTIDARKVIIAQYASYVDGMDDPEKLMGKQVINNALDKEICAMSMALRFLTYGELTRVPNVKPEEKTVFGSVSMATTNLVNYFSKLIWQGGHVITQKNLNWPVKSSIINSIAFFPICKAGKYLFLDFMARSKLASTCGPEYFRGIDISEVISKAVGEKNILSQKTSLSALELLIQSPLARPGAGEPSHVNKVFCRILCTTQDL